MSLTSAIYNRSYGLIQLGLTTNCQITTTNLYNHFFLDYTIIYYCPYSSLLRLFGRKENKEEKKKNLS